MNFLREPFETVQKASQARSAILVIALGCLALTGISGYSAPAELTIQEIVTKVATSVVTIEVFDKGGDLIGGGTGFFVGPNLVLTNAHVVDGAYSMSVSLRVPKKIDRQPRITKYDGEADLALLHVGSIDAPALTFEAGVQIMPGQPVIVYGNGYEGKHLVSEGIVRACLPDAIIFSAPIHDGHSGSPLLNQSGMVIGVSRASFSKGNMAFAVPIPLVKKFMNSPDSPRSFPVAGTSLFWPRLWKSVSSVFEGVFGWIFNLGQLLFSLYLKLAAILISVLVLLNIGGFIKKTLKDRKATSDLEPKPVLAYVAFAVWLVMLIMSVSIGLLAIAFLLSGEFDFSLILLGIALLVSGFLSYIARQYYKQRRTGKKKSGQKMATAVADLHRFGQRTD